MFGHDSMQKQLSVFTTSEQYKSTVWEKNNIRAQESIKVQEGARVWVHECENSVLVPLPPLSAYVQMNLIQQEGVKSSNHP